MKILNAHATISRREALKLLASTGGIAAASALFSQQWPWLVAKANLQTMQTTDIQITDSGFQPTTVTISVGGTVKWVNKTTTTYTLQIIPQVYHKTFLPIIMGKAPASKNLSISSTVAPQQATSIQQVLLPNGEFSYTFEAWGHHDFSLLEKPDFKGQVIVPQANFTAGNYLISVSNPNKFQVAYKEEPGWIIAADPNTIVRSMGPVYGVDWIEGAPWRNVPRNFTASRQAPWPKITKITLQVNFGPSPNAPAPGTALWCYVASGGQGGEYVVESQLVLNNRLIVGTITIDLPTIGSGFSPYYFSLAFKNRIITTVGGQSVDTANFVVPGIRGYSGMA